MSPEIKQDGKEEVNPYDGIQFIVYDASDFHPRGSLRKGQISPPHNLSETPSDINSVEDIIDNLTRKNPNNEWSVRSAIKSLKRSHQETDVINDQPSRVFPEELSPKLNLNFMRASFRRVEHDKECDMWEKGDKIVIIFNPVVEHMLAVDLKRGSIVPVWEGFDDAQSLKEFNNEIKSPKQQRYRESSRKSYKLDPDNIPFEQLDLNSPEIPEAKDKGDRNKYPEETQKFWNKMHIADVEVEWLLLPNIDLIVEITEAVHRFAKKNGRDDARELLSDFRHYKFDVIKDIVWDINLNRRLNKNNKKIDINSVSNCFETLFKAEKQYFNCIKDLYWNKGGPEPFDTLINVFWFRFDYSRLSRNWKSRRETFQSIKSWHYKNAQMNRILSWVNETYGTYIWSWKELEENNITYDIKVVEKEMGPLDKYVHKDWIERDFKKAEKKFRPSYLTKLLWSTLKHTSLSTWKTNGTFLTSDFKYKDPEIWDEHFCDQQSLLHTDFQGRFLLPGETLPMSLLNLSSLPDSERQIRERLYLKAENMGLDLINDNEGIEKIANQLINENRQLKHFESIANNFQEVVAKTPLKKLIHKVDKLPPLYRCLVLHRLGYNSKIINKADKNLVKIDNDLKVQWVIKILFDGKSNRYYSSLKKATFLLNK